MRATPIDRISAIISLKPICETLTYWQFFSGGFARDSPHFRFRIVQFASSASQPFPRQRFSHRLESPASHVTPASGTLRLSRIIRGRTFLFLLPFAPRLPIMTTSDSPQVAQAQAAIQVARQEGKLTASSVENLDRWITQPQYRRYQAPIIELIERQDWEQLDLLFFEVIPFGTGGRRGAMADFGSATINERTVAESAYGLASYWNSQANGKQGRAAIAFDTRNRSEEFARLTATTLAACGMQVFCYEEPRSTPALSFAVRHLKCDVGVMITASHNPPGDNGFKAYWNNGGQVLPPHDEGIINHVYSATDIPTCDFDEARAIGKIELLGPEIDEAYLRAVQSVGLSEGRDVSILFSPMHGVGESNVWNVLDRAGFQQVEIYGPHRERNGNFPNVSKHFPNPERPEVFEPLIEHAKSQGHDVVMATDPDSDRIGVAVRDREGEYTILSGNQVGALCADHVLSKRSERGTLGEKNYLTITMVTTPLISEIARAHQVRCIDDLLVGFKYIGQTMDREGPEGFVFGGEESLGYLAGSYARDKDAAVGGLLIAELAAELKARGKTLLDRLDELYVAHGYFLEGQRSETCPGPSGKAQIARIMAAFRDTPPAELGGVALAEMRDYQAHEIRAIPENTHLAELREPSGNLLFLDSAPGEFRCSIAVRPSGTEPKIKFYFFASATVAGADTLAETKRSTQERLVTIQNALSEWAREQAARHDG